MYKYLLMGIDRTVQNLVRSQQARRSQSNAILEQDARLLQMYQRPNTVPMIELRRLPRRHISRALCHMNGGQRNDGAEKQRLIQRKPGYVEREEAPRLVAQIVPRCYISNVVVEVARDLGPLEALPAYFWCW